MESPEHELNGASVAAAAAALQVGQLANEGAEMRAQQPSELYVIGVWELYEVCYWIFHN